MTKILLLFSFFTLPFISNNNKWKEYISYEGEFKVETPGEIKEVINTAETTLGQLEYHIFVHQDTDSDADNLMYMISYCDYPQGSIHSDSTELIKEFFDATIEESTKSVYGKLIYSNDIKVHNFPGKLWRVDYGEGRGIIRTKAFIKGNRFYTIQTACNRDKSLNMSSDKFMDSFYLLDEVEKSKKPKKKINLNGSSIPLSPNR